MTTPTSTWLNEYDRLDRAVDRVSAALDHLGKHVKSSGGGRRTHLQASCPLHTDRKPSLSVDDYGEGRLVLCCHSCQGAEEDLVAALGLRDDQLWDRQAQPCPVCGDRSIDPTGTGNYVHDRCAGGTPPRRGRSPRRPSSGRRRKPGPLPNRVTVDADEPRYRLRGVRRKTRYDHMTVDGEVVAYGERSEELRLYDGESAPRTVKSFWVQFADGRGGWGKKEAAPPGLVVPLYRAPEVAAAIAAGRTVWVAEGHKDADRLREAGVVATTNLAGAPNFNADDAAQLADADVVAVVDQDHAGYSRGSKVLRLLEGVTRSVQVVVPRLTENKADATDHLEAGFGLDDFVPVSVAELEARHLVAQITHRIGLPDLAVATREVHAQLSLAEEATDRAPKRAETHRRYAARWAEEAGRRLERLAELCRRLVEMEACTAEQRQAAEAAMAEETTAVAALYRACGATPADPIAGLLDHPAAGTGGAEPGTEPGTGDGPANGGGDGGGGDGMVLDPQPPQWQRFPQHPVVMHRGEWRYDTGSHVDRGVYCFDQGTDSRPGRWRWLAPLPYVRARIVRRDGQGIRCGTDYLLAAAEEGGKTITATHLSLRDGTWANDLGLDLSFDDKVVKAAATAIATHASTHAPEVESAPRVDPDTGHIGVALPETLPAGYLACAPGDRDAGLAAWAEIIRVAVTAPKMALALGASAVSPFISSLRSHHQSHFVALYGDSRQGKSTTMKLVGGVWGNSVPHGDAGGVVSTWDVSGIGVGRYVGMLGVLPPFLDESGMRNATPAEWGKLIYSLCEGAQRMVGETRGPGLRRSKPWRGIFFSAGNGRLSNGLGAGPYAGVACRVIDLGTPLTVSAEQAEQLEEVLLPAAYGHAGAAILDQVSVADVQALVDDAVADLGLPEGGTSRTVTKELHTHIAGAAVLDSLAGTGGLLRAAALAAARDYLAEWSEPQHDADRLLAELRDWYGREPAKWPTVSQYQETKQPRPGGEPTGFGRTPLAELPQHQVDREEAGLWADDGSWVAVFKKAWKAMVEEHGLDHSVVCRELHRRGLLYVTSQQRKKGEWTNRAVRGMADMYKLMIPAEIPDDVPEDEPAGDKPAEPLDPDPDEAEGDRAEPEPAQSAGSQTDTEVLAEEPDAAQPASGEPGVQTPYGVRTGSVRGGVRGDNAPLTRGVRGVRGDRTEITYTPACTEPSGEEDQPINLDPEAETGIFRSSLGTEHRRQRALESGPCHRCSTPTAHLLDGRRLHPRCLEDQLRSDAAASDRGVTRADELTAEATAAWTDEQLEAAVQDHLDDPEGVAALEQLIDARQAAAEAAEGDGTSRGDTAGVARAAGPGPGTSGRFAAPAAVLDAHHAHLAGQSARPWHADHLGQLALLAGPDRLRLGWGGGDRYPDEGQLWLDADALQRLGLPVTVDVGEGLAVSSRARQGAVERAFKPLLKLPAVADALAEGWQIGKHGLDAWTRIWHPTLLPRGAWLVALPWQRVADVPLLEGLDETRPAAHLAERLAGWAAAVGISYRLSPASTGVDLVDHTRPPRLSHDDDRGAARNRRALVKGEPAELPDFLRRARDDRFRTVEADFSWWRPWASLLASERAQPYVAMYDRGRSYLGPWTSIELGLEGLVHRTGDAAHWDGKEMPGFYLVDRWMWDAWWLPDPAGAVSAFVERNRVWVTSHTLRQLKASGVEPRVHESYTWQINSRYLEPAGKRIGDALTAGADPAVVATIKALYSSTVGKLGERDHQPDYHLWRPDWRHHIIANTRTAIMSTLRGIHDRTGAAALLVDRDAIAFAVDNPDPWQAWPGDPKKLGTSTGQWKPIGAAPLEAWGPQFLPKPGRAGQKWAYRDAVQALTQPDQQ